MSGSRFICTATLLFCATLAAASNDARAVYRGGGHFNPGGGYRASPYGPDVRRHNDGPWNGAETMRNGGSNGFPEDGPNYPPGPMGAYGDGEPPPWAHRNAGVEHPREYGDEPGYGDAPPHGHWPPPRWPHRPALGETPVIVDAPESDDGGDDTPSRWRRPPHYVPPARGSHEPTFVDEKPPVVSTPQPKVVYAKPPVVVAPPLQPAPQPKVVYEKRPVVTQPPVQPKPQPTFAYAKPPIFIAPPPKPPTSAPPPRAALPLVGETRFRAGEVLVEVPYATPDARVAEVLRRHGLTEVEVARIDLLQQSLRRWQIPDGRLATAVVTELAQETALARAQPNYLFAAADDASPAPVATPQPAASVDATLSLAQYALVKMKVAPSLEDASAAPIRVAVIDTAIDEAHPDLKGVVEQSYDAIGDGSPARSKSHGTAMAGGIAADGELRGVATRVKLLSARALDSDGDGEPRGTTLSIVKALDWSVLQKAQIVNMSFAGPDDPTLRDALARASAQGVALIGAAGNAGPKAPPQYPGADANVIAATATDENDKLYSLANVGAYVAISAPGVDVLLPSPDGGYAMESGTSVSSALISGVVALMLERQPRLKPIDIRQRLTATATPLGGPERASEFGAGLVDASKAVSR